MEFTQRTLSENQEKLERKFREREEERIENSRRKLT